jgi:hypothetical protein
VGAVPGSPTSTWCCPTTPPVSTTARSTSPRKRRPHGKPPSAGTTSTQSSGLPKLERSEQRQRIERPHRMPDLRRRCRSVGSPGASKCRSASFLATRPRAVQPEPTFGSAGLPARADARRVSLRCGYRTVCVLSRARRRGRQPCGRATRVRQRLVEVRRLLAPATGCRLAATAVLDSRRGTRTADMYRVDRLRSVAVARGSNPVSGFARVRGSGVRGRWRCALSRGVIGDQPHHFLRMVEVVVVDKDRGGVGRRAVTDVALDPGDVARQTGPPPQ